MWYWVAFCLCAHQEYLIIYVWQRVPEYRGQSYFCDSTESYGGCRATMSTTLWMLTRQCRRGQYWEWTMVSWQRLARFWPMRRIQLQWQHLPTLGKVQHRNQCMSAPSLEVSWWARFLFFCSWFLLSTYRHDMLSQKCIQCLQFVQVMVVKKSCLEVLFQSTSASIPEASNKLGEWVTEWLNTRFFSMG